MDTIELLARFAYKPNELRRCGPQDANLALYDYILNKKNPENIKTLLLSFETLQPYLEFIAEKTQKGLFDREVVEAYWLGNSLLDQFDAKDMQRISKKVDKRLCLPVSKSGTAKSEYVPHHSFHVMYVGSKTCDKFPALFENMQKCLVTWGKVKEIYINELVVTQKPLVYHNKEYGIGESIEKKVSFDRKLLPNLNLGDIIAIHWDFAVMKLSREQLYNLEKYTLRNIAAVNSERR
ncbi:MAG: DUF6390 family protein [Candidatus Woesearchaeota archaeon]